MGILDSIKEKAFGQFIDVIEWIDATRNTLVWKFPRGDNEIKNGAQLIVRESQAAVFLHEGELGDVFKPGRVELTTSNIPILTTLKSWRYAFNSPFKCDVYFINTRQFTDQKWGTANPIMLRDAEFGPLRLRAFGSYAFSVTDPGKFIVTMAGTNPVLVSEDVTGQLRNILVSRFADALGEAKIPALDLAAQYNEMGDFLRNILQKDFDEYGITLNKFLIENISLPPEVEQALDKRSQMGILGDMGKYTQFQAANALGDAAKNPGTAGNMMGMLAGVNLGGMVGGNLQTAFAQPVAPGSAPAPAPAPAPGGPPPLPGASWFAGINGKSEGPFDEAALAARIASGALTQDTLLWKQGMASWQKASNLAEISGLFAAVPPPLPPA
ncbi:MAG: SPFH domain-containing protein [Planctomycetota bacterium]|jgi:membrane protease subunit (stomatin/prohibitin family)|nr:SPFH domain-containing protein [Planctomycetota bacterium]